MGAPKRPKIINGAECWKCSKCDQWKPREGFYITSSGRPRSNCRKCHRHDVNSRAALKRQANRERCRLWREANPEASATNSKRYAKNNRERIKKQKREEARSTKGRARDALHKAVYRGKIIKPSRCQDCGDPVPKEQLHGHHEDYGKPLDVEWLCGTCHGARHRINEETEQGR